MLDKEKLISSTDKQDVLSKQELKTEISKLEDNIKFTETKNKPRNDILPLDNGKNKTNKKKSKLVYKKDNHFKPDGEKQTVDTKTQNKPSDKTNVHNVNPYYENNKTKDDLNHIPDNEITDVEYVEPCEKLQYKNALEK